MTPVTWFDAVLETDPGRIFIETPDGKTYAYLVFPIRGKMQASTLEQKPAYWPAPEKNPEE